jgi:hypothetical protein
MVLDRWSWATKAALPSVRTEDSIKLATIEDGPDHGMVPVVDSSVTIDIIPCAMHVLRS